MTTSDSSVGTVVLVAEELGVVVEVDVVDEVLEVDVVGVVVDVVEVDDVLDVLDVLESSVASLVTDRVSTTSVVVVLEVEEVEVLEVLDVGTLDVEEVDVVDSVGGSSTIGVSVHMRAGSDCSAALASATGNNATIAANDAMREPRRLSARAHQKRLIPNTPRME